MEVFLFVTVGWIFSVCLHEFGHAIVAYHGGDHTVKDKGYLTLNPLRYANPMLSFVMPMLFLFLGGLGLPGGAVYIESERLRSNLWRTATSLAGVAVNVILILLLCIPIWLGVVDAQKAPGLAAGLAFLILLEVSSIILNLLPIPPLDGFQALAPWLPKSITEPLYAQSTVALWVLFLALWYVPALNQAFWNFAYSISALLGVDPDLAFTGAWLFRFWKH